jgi:regulator of RNase E activity RraB
MSEHWEFYPTRIEDQEAYVTYDHGLGETIDALALPMVLRVRVKLDDPSPEGFPKQEEFERLAALEDALARRVRAAGGVFAGSLTTGGARFFHCFVAFDQDAARRLVQQVAGEGGYELGMVLKPDPEKSSYWEDLYPSPLEWRVIQDMKVLRALQADGDDPSVARRVDHWLYFPRPAERDRFAAWAAANGFDVEGPVDGEDAERKYGLRVYHTARTELDEITAATQLLSRQAAEAGGDYDGWQTRLEKRG